MDGTLGISGICKRLGVSKPRLYRIIGNPDERFPPMFPLGGRKVVDKRDLERWIEGKKRAALARH